MRIISYNGKLLGVNGKAVDPQGLIAGDVINTEIDISKTANIEITDNGDILTWDVPTITYADVTYKSNTGDIIYTVYVDDEEYWIGSNNQCNINGVVPETHSFKIIAKVTVTYTKNTEDTSEKEETAIKHIKLNNPDLIIMMINQTLKMFITPSQWADSYKIVVKKELDDSIFTQFNVNSDDVNTRIIYPMGEEDSGNFIFEVQAFSDSEYVDTSNLVTKVVYYDKTYNNSIYTVRRLKYTIENGVKTFNTDPEWEKLDDNRNLVATANKLQSTPEVFEPVRDDYAMAINGGTLPFWKDIKIVNVDHTTREVISELGDDDFCWGNVGSSAPQIIDVMTCFPDSYMKRWEVIEDNATYEYISLAEQDEPEYVKIPAFRVSTVHCSSQGHSYFKHSNYSACPSSYFKYATMRSNFNTYLNSSSNTITFAHNMDWHWDILMCLYLIKYANFNSQKMVGYSNENYSSYPDNASSRSILNGRDGFIGADDYDAGTGSVAVWCLGICNLWGQWFTRVDSLVTSWNGNVYLITNPKLYNLTDGTSLPNMTNYKVLYTLPDSTPTGYVYVSCFHVNNILDNKFAQFIMYIDKNDCNIATSGNLEDSVCDKVYYYPNGLPVAIRIAGGYRKGGGIFNYFYSYPIEQSSNVGYRLCEIYQKDLEEYV